MAIAMLLKNTVDSAGRFFEGKCRWVGGEQDGVDALTGWLHCVALSHAFVLLS